MVLHDATLGPSTTGRGRVASKTSEDMSGLFHRDESGNADLGAPVLSLAELIARLERMPSGVSANLQLDVKVLDGRPLSERSIADAAAAIADVKDKITVGSHYLDEVLRLAAAVPGIRIGYDPMMAASRDRGLVENPERLLRHIERRSAGLALAYLRYDAVLAAEQRGFPLVRRLLDLGIETDAWTVNPGPKTAGDLLLRLAEAGVRQITTDAPREIAGELRYALSLAHSVRTD
jgi:glycerophosphoryl diester phosphodiesterase